MNMKLITFAAAVMICAPTLAGAQGLVGGATEGAKTGNHVAGPVGGVVGGVVGGAVGAVEGGVTGMLGIEQRPRFHDYTRGEHHASYRYHHRVVVGAVLPRHGVTYHEVPAEYGVSKYRYTIVNDHAVLVDPATRRIVQVVD